MSGGHRKLYERSCNSTAPKVTGCLWFFWKKVLMRRLLSTTSSHVLEYSSSKICIQKSWDLIFCSQNRHFGAGEWPTPSASERAWGEPSSFGEFTATTGTQPLGMISDTFSSVTNIPDTMEARSAALCGRNAKTYPIMQKPTPVVGIIQNPVSE